MDKYDAETLTDAEWSGLVKDAADAGRKAGRNAAEWAMQGERRDYARILRGIEDGDPEIMDVLPCLDLSGQWADGATEDDVIVDAIGPSYDLNDDERDEIVNAYRDGYDEAAVLEVERICRFHADE